MKFLLPLLFSLLLSANKYCYTCHVQIYLAETHTKKEWKRLYDSKALLQKIHKKNLKVLQYLNSPAYDADTLYKDMLFFAPESQEDTSENSFITNSPYKECVLCHNGTPLYTLWVKSQWTELESKKEELAQIHKDNPEVSAFILSKDFEKILPTLQKEMLSKARNPQLITIKEGDIRFTLDLNDATKEYTQELFNALKKELKSHNIHDKISIYLERGEDNLNVVSTTVTILSGLLAPSTQEATWFMQVNYKKRAYTLYTTKSYTSGFFAATSPLIHSENIKELVTLFMQKLQKEREE